MNVQPRNATLAVTFRWFPVWKAVEGARSNEVSGIVKQPNPKRRTSPETKKGAVMKSSQFRSAGMFSAVNVALPAVVLLLLASLQPAQADSGNRQSMCSIAHQSEP